MNANAGQPGKTISAEFTATTFVYDEALEAGIEEGVQ